MFHVCLFFLVFARAKRPWRFVAKRGTKRKRQGDMFNFQKGNIICCFCWGIGVNPPGSCN